MKPAALRAMQMLGAALWMVYGIFIGATPVIVANVLVFSAAAWTVLRNSSAASESQECRESRWLCLRSLDHDSS